jgi:hypothetical protein
MAAASASAVLNGALAVNSAPRISPKGDLSIPLKSPAPSDCKAVGSPGRSLGDALHHLPPDVSDPLVGHRGVNNGVRDRAMAHESLQEVLTKQPEASIFAVRLAE